MLPHCTVLFHRAATEAEVFYLSKLNRHCDDNPDRGEIDLFRDSPNEVHMS